MQENGKIYKIYNNINEKVYIGQTWQTLKKRFAIHINYNSACVKLNNAIKKYGVENFFIEKLIECNNQTEMNYWENFYITKYNSIKNGYNLREGGAFGKFSEESKIKMSKSQIGKKLSQETKNKISISGKGRVCSEKTRNKLSLALKGKKRKPLSEEHKAKQSMALKGKAKSELHKDNIQSASFDRKCKVSFEDVELIKQMYKIGLSSFKIAPLFNISASYVRGILNGTDRNINYSRRRPK
jgi:group I intron endonuclease